VVAAQALALEAHPPVEADRRLVVGPDLEFDLVDVGGASGERGVHQHPAAAVAAVRGEDPHPQREDAAGAGRPQSQRADHLALVVEHEDQLAFFDRLPVAHLQLGGAGRRLGGEPGLFVDHGLHPAPDRRAILDSGRPHPHDPEDRSLR